MARAKAPDRLAATFTMRTGNLILEASEGPFSVPAWRHARTASDQSLSVALAGRAVRLQSNIMLLR